jgi:hypothetical protein
MLFSYASPTIGRLDAGGHGYDDGRKEPRMDDPGERYNGTAGILLAEEQRVGLLLLDADTWEMSEGLFR